MTVPFVDLAPQNEPLRAGVVADVDALILRGDFTSGAAVREFEQAWAGYCRNVGPWYCAGVASGLDALRLALLALNVGPGSRVVVPAMTFQATWEAVTQTGAALVPADVAEDGLLDAKAMPADADAVVPVHLYGRMADVRAIREAIPHAYVVEDAAQAHGSRRRLAPREITISPGVLSHAVAYSFYPTKPLGAFGDAGAVTTSFDWVDRRVRELREHGQSAKYEHVRVGYTARLDTVQALVLLRKLPLLDGWNRQRRDAARFYGEVLAGVGDLRLPPDPGYPNAGGQDACHLYAVRTADPEELAIYLAARGIGTGRHYPVPPHLSPAYAHLGYGEGSFPVAERIARETLSLPIYAGITEAQQVEVADAVRAWFDG